MGKLWTFKNSIWPTFSRHLKYLISYQNLFNCLVLRYQYYDSICVSADMQSDVTKPTIWPLPLVHLQIFKTTHNFQVFQLI